MTARISSYRPGLVDLVAGQISREIFVNNEIYQEELERVFARAWLFVGHESQIPNSGDFFVSSMGEESVILCRDRAQKVHVFLNSCRHRGMKVCRYDEGNAAVLTCPRPARQRGDQPERDREAEHRHHQRHPSRDEGSKRDQEDEQRQR